MQMQKIKPRRMQFKFWLDANRENEAALGAYLDDMKQKRKLTATIRDAVRLLWWLRSGRAEVLLEMFPNIEDMIQRARVEAAMRSNKARAYDESYHR